MKTGEIEESPGVVSSMRVTLRHARRMETLCTLAAIILGIGMLVRGDYALLPLALLIGGGGCVGKIAVSAAKAWQAQAETPPLDDDKDTKVQGFREGA